MQRHHRQNTAAPRSKGYVLVAQSHPKLDMLSTKLFRISACFKPFCRQSARCVSYIQGQSPEGEPKVREYFYYIDHQGQVSLSCMILIYIMPGGGVLRFRMGTDVRPGIPTTTL